MVPNTPNGGERHERLDGEEQHEDKNEHHELHEDAHHGEQDPACDSSRLRVRITEQSSAVFRWR